MEHERYALWVMSRPSTREIVPLLGTVHDREGGE
jgi:hypothetical protein